MAFEKDTIVSPGTRVIQYHYYYYYYHYYYYKYEPTITVIKVKTMYTLKHSLIPPMHLFAFWALTISVKVFRKGVISFSCNDLNLK